MNFFHQKYSIDRGGFMFRRCTCAAVMLIALLSFSGCELPFDLPFDLPGAGTASQQPGSGQAASEGAQAQPLEDGGGAVGQGTPRPVTPASMARVPQTGTNSISQGGATVDISNTSSGYFMVRFDGNVSRFVVRVEHSAAQQPCDFHMRPSSWETVPLTHGNGTYTVTVLEHVADGMFAVTLTTTIDVSMSDPFLPWLYPNQFVNFTPQTNAVLEAERLAQGAFSELDVVRAVYNFVITHITYDHAFAQGVTSGTITEYLPDLDDILSRGTGICFDYAAVMAAMLRAQNIPTRLEIGFVSGGVFHAWVTVHTEEHGWVGVAEFASGANWTLMDPTFSASAGGQGGQDLAAFIGDGTNYQTVFRR